MENKSSCVHRDQIFLLDKEKDGDEVYSFLSIYQACCFFLQKRLRAFVDFIL